MNINRIKQKLGFELSKKSVNTDSFLKIKIESKGKQLPSSDINKVVNLGDRFDTERNRSKFYRIIGTINPTISNSLFNLNNGSLGDAQTLSYFNSFDFLDTSYPKDNDVADSTDNTFVNSLKNLKEYNGWFGYFNPDKTQKGLCGFIDMEPTRARFSFVPDIKPYMNAVLPVKNWELTITYPKSVDREHTMVKGGLLIIDIKSVSVSTRTMVALGMACKHNLNIGDTVRLSGTNGYNGDHTIIRTGLDNGDLKDNYFVIDLQPTGSIGSNSRMKRMFGKQESEYYFRKFKKIKTRSNNVIEQDDYETYKLAFSENVYSDPITQFAFNEDINIDKLTDNLGRPLTEIYLSIIKTDSDSLFTSVSSGIESPYINKLTTGSLNNYIKSVPVINRIHNGGTLPFESHIPLETDIIINDNNFYGDLVEFNKYEVKETILGEVMHRFNTKNRETPSNIDYVDSLGVTPILTNVDLGPRHEGYFYKPHNLIRLKEVSKYVEQGEINIDEIPDYAINLGDGRYLWRDIIDVGVSSGVGKALDYPFLNGCHYIYQNNIFNVKRQDPFNDWGLFYTKFPSDNVGGKITEKFIIKSEDDVC